MARPKISLETIEDAQQAVPEPAPVEDDLRQAYIEALRADTEARKRVVKATTIIFVVLNVLVVAFLAWAFFEDIELMTRSPQVLKPVERLVTPNVLMTLIAATVVQTGSGFLAIVSYLFPKGKQRPPELR